MESYLNIVQIEPARFRRAPEERIVSMSQAAVAHFERAMDYVAPAVLLAIGLVAALATAMIGS
jgi:hypothetical protein